MAEDDTGGGKAHDANKRPRLDDAAVSEQRAAFEEDTALIRSMGRGESGEGEGAPSAPDGDAGATANNGDGGEEGGAPSQQQGGESTVQSPQPSGESTSQHRPTGAGRPSAEAAGALESDDDEEGEGNWLKNFTPHHTRVGAAYQVAELPAASPPSAAAPVRASGSCVSPGSSS